MLAAMMTATFQHVEKSLDICVGVRMGMFQRMPNAGLCSQMDHLCKAMLLEQGFDCSPIDEIELLEAEAGTFLEDVKARLFQAGIVVVIDAVEANDGAT